MPNLRTKFLTVPARSDSVSEQQRSPIPTTPIPPTLTGTVTPIVPRTPITRIATRTMAVTHITKRGKLHFMK